MASDARAVGEARGFRSVMGGRFMARDGPARVPGAAFCNKKLCFVAVDVSTLADLLRELSDDPRAYAVKFSVTPRDGMYLGRCFFVDAPTVGETWARFKPHPKVFCSVQDDDFVAPWRRAPRRGG